ncbi:AraC family transcriptional regulator [Winogradskyella forsetii]|uniref:AraC family transcriptional regulator n=1 Tax=Winogradskyella forsetii TaxID=2686077 RepID=UPI0015BFDDAE|nr:AraC family transcriptional regulator [Winogradskyella forsetii]
MKIQVKFDFLSICNNLLSEKLVRLGIKYKLNSSSEIEILERLSPEDKMLLYKELNSSGIHVIDNHQSILVQRVKNILMEIIKLDNYNDDFKVSAYIEDRLPHSYSYLSRVFSEATFMSIEKFLILKKIDYVKDLLIEDGLSLTEIAYKLNYSSVSHLSRQFKKTTGFSPSYFVNLKKQITTATKKN